MDYKLIGSSCGQHGPYTFYKAFKYTKNNKSNILSLSEFFFVKLWPDSDLISIGELQLLWEDKNSEQTLACLRLYILPENTPDGRNDIHGEDEVLAITEKVVLRVEDLLTWIHVSPDWHWGLGAIWSKEVKPSVHEIKKELEDDDTESNGPIPTTGLATDPPLYPTNSLIDMNDVLTEKQKFDTSHWEDTPGVIVLSYPRYCRYRGLLKRLEGVYNKWLRDSLILALGGFTSPFKNTRILFCKDTFDYPELEVHELLCNHLAPKLKGKGSRKRKKKELSASEDEEGEGEEDESDNESDSSQSTSSSSSKAMPAVSITNIKTGGMKPRLRCTLEVGNRVTNSAPISYLNVSSSTSNNTNVHYGTADEKKFLQGLHAFMRSRSTPIGRIPVVGFKEVNLYKLYKKVIELGGYDVVTNNKLWKLVYQVTGGDMSCTSAATLSRRHYEKLLLPYEKFLKNKASAAVISPSFSISQLRFGNAVKISPLRNNGKSLVNDKTEKRVEKENIPERMKSMLGSSVTIIKKEPKDESNSVSSDASSIKPNVTIKSTGPVVKKQKLDILKQGGLEVTPIALQAGSYSGSDGDEKPVVKKERTTPPPPVNITKNNKVSITVTPDIAHLKGGNNKVSVTVTPDVSHLIFPWSGMNSNGPGPSKQKPNPPNSAGNAVLYGAGSAVGLPVEAVLGGGQPSSAPIDLRTSKVKKPNIGSNLEISLVPSGTKKSIHNQPPARSQTHQRAPHQRAQTPRYNSPIYTLKTSPNTAPYVPLIDPAYLCGNIVTQKLPPFVAPNPATSSPASINNYYKDLLRSQGIFNLLPDGSTSISLVGQSTPTSK